MTTGSLRSALCLQSVLYLKQMERQLSDLQEENHRLRELVGIGDKPVTTSGLSSPPGQAKPAYSRFPLPQRFPPLALHACLHLCVLVAWQTSILQHCKVSLSSLFVSICSATEAHISHQIRWICVHSSIARYPPIMITCTAPYLC